MLIYFICFSRLFNEIFGAVRIVMSKIKGEERPFQPYFWTDILERGGRVRNGEGDEKGFLKPMTVTVIFVVLLLSVSNR